MPAVSYYKGIHFNAPIIYNRAIESLQKCSDTVLQRISFLCRYLYSQEIKRYHYYEKYPSNIPSGKTLQDYSVSGIVSVNKQAGDGKINIGFATDSQRVLSSVIGKADNATPPPGADINEVPTPGLVFETQNYNLYQYASIPSRPADTVLSSDSYLIHDSGWFGGSLRVSGGRREEDLTHTIVFDALNQLNKGDQIGSYYIANGDDLDPNTGMPLTGGDPGTWFDCGVFFRDTLFDPATSVINPGTGFSQVSIPYNLWVKVDLDNVTFDFPSNVQGLTRFNSTLDTDGGLEEFNPNFSPSDVFFNNSSGLDTLDSAPPLFKNILMPIFHRYYPGYAINSTDPGRNDRKGRVFDNTYEKSEVIAVTTGGVYTKLGEPKFKDALGNFYGSNQNFLRIRNTYFFKIETPLT
tara:strand:- start:405 stop:1628 length:1224 start_codon:yes stop_codon:yes gene_type:complete